MNDMLIKTIAALWVVIFACDPIAGIIIYPITGVIIAMLVFKEAGFLLNSNMYSFLSLYWLPSVVFVYMMED